MQSVRSILNQEAAVGKKRPDLLDQLNLKEELIKQTIEQRHSTRNHKYSNMISEGKYETISGIMDKKLAARKSPRRKPGVFEGSLSRLTSLPLGDTSVLAGMHVQNNETIRNRID